MPDIMPVAKARLKAVLPRSVRSAIRRAMSYRSETYGIRNYWTKDDIAEWPPRVSQPADDVNRFEYSLFSQNGEDGIIRYLFDQIGVRSRLFLEFGFGVTENNSLRLMLKERFGGLFIDSNERTVRLFNHAAKSLKGGHVRAVRQLLDLQNLEATIMDGGLRREIDFMSIDVDGNDYWFWERIACVRPRVVVVEYNASLGSTLSLSVPYDPLFDRHKKHQSGFYHGASLAALASLGRRKGYRLVGCDSTGVNAFFLCQDCHAPNVKTQTPDLAFRPQKSRLERGFSPEEQYRIVGDLPYVEII
jgi:hypothetical protein